MRAVMIVGCVMLMGCGSKMSMLDTARTIPALTAKYIEPTGTDWQPHFDDLKARLEGWGIMFVEFPPTLLGAFYGLSDAREGWIALEPTLGVNVAFATLCHEAAHLVAPPALRNNKSVSEVFAEVVGYEVGKFYGVTLNPEQYIAAYKDGFSIVENDLQVDVKVAVKLLTGQLPAPVFTFPGRSDGGE